MKRRMFLHGVGGTALAIPFLNSLERQAGAQLAESPKRLVIYYTNNGCITNRWFPSVENGEIDASSLAGKTLEPLTPYVSKLLFPRGMGMFPKGTINGYFDPHDQGMGSKLTCAPIDPEGGHYATSRSLDHVAAELKNQGTNKSPLVLSVGFASDNVKQVLSYEAANTPYLPETNPANVYSGLTGVFGTGAAPAGAPATTEQDYLVSQGNSVIDLVREDLNSLTRQSMSNADKSKITDWLSLLRETELAVVPAACNADAATQLGITDDAVAAAGGQGGFGGDLATAFTSGGDMMIKLIALTLMCDANRSVVLHWPGFVTFNWDGIVHEYDHHGLSHRVGSAAVGGTCVDGVIEMLYQIDSWYTGRYTKLVGLLDSITEGEGTLLDNTATMWLPELADGNAHNNNNLPIVIAGSAGGYLRTGVSVNVEGKEIGTGNSEEFCKEPGDEVGFSFNSGGEVPLNKLYTTLLNAIGATNADGSPIESFGTWDSNTEGISNPGELDDLKA